MPSLYEIASQFAFLTGDGEIPIDVEAQIDALGMSMEAKVDAICRIIQERRAEAAKFKHEAERLSEIADRATVAADRLKRYVRDSMQMAGLKTLETELFRLRLQANPPSADCVGDPPAEFSRVKVEWDKKAVIEAHKAGLPLPSGAAVTQGVSLRGVS